MSDIGDLDIRVAPDADEIRRLAGADSDTVHIFSGIRHVPTIVAGLRAVLRSGGRLAIMSEPRVMEGWRGKLRLLQSWLTERRLRRRASFVLAIGRHGPRWFEAAGYAPRRIFSFAYFLPVTSLAPSPDGNANVPLIGFVARLIPEKGVGLFLDALKRVRVPHRVTIAGAGPLATDVAAALGTMSNAEFRGVIPMDAVPQVLAELDLLVQPSLTTDDGWAAIVSEALMMGTKVVATRQVGASILLDDPALGEVCSADAESCAHAIDAALSSGLTGRERAARARWARTHLSGEAGADRLIAILRHRFENGPPPPPFPAPHFLTETV